MARKSARTTARRETIIRAIRSGATKKAAAAHAGIHYDTLRQWALDVPAFDEDIERAHADWLVSQLAGITMAGRRDWRAAAWLIEHHPATRSEFAAMPKGQVVIEGGDTPVRVESQHVVAVQLDDPAARLADIAATLDALVRAGIAPPAPPPRLLRGADGDP